MDSQISHGSGFIVALGFMGHISKTGGQFVREGGLGGNEKLVQERVRRASEL